MEPIFEKEFLPVNYGFRPQRGCKDALRQVDELLREGYTTVVDADLASYYDSIPHQPLLERVAERISDGRVLNLIGRFLEQAVMDGLECWTPTAGTPQGAVLSPLLANLYLHPLDRMITERGWKMVRYADDCVPRRRTPGVSPACSSAAQVMRAGPSKPPCRRRLQTTHCGCAQEAWS
jgi:RNA-directed DNA polymerase